MKRLLLLPILLAATTSHSQSVAMDFNMSDCDGNMHHLFSHLDSGYVVILEFFMTSCNPCIEAGQHLEELRNDLIAEHGNWIKFYHFAYSNSYDCSTVANWVDSYGFTSVPFDSGALQVAYYGGFGMPTIAVVAGSSHQVLFKKIGFVPGDTGTIGTAIRSYFNPSGITAPVTATFEVSPNPASQSVTLRLNGPGGQLRLSLLDLSGQETTLLSESIAAGEVTRSMPLHDLPAGIYFVKTELNGNTSVQKLIIVSE